jgi:hypothetical protein
MLQAGGIAMFANEVNWKEAAAEVWHRLRHLTPRKAWAWLTDGYGVRLIAAASIALGFLIQAIDL